MPQLRRTTLPLLALISFALSPWWLQASPLPPNVQACRSANGRFLVVAETDYAEPNPYVMRHVLRTSYHVLELESFPNSKDRLSAPMPFWSSRWEVTPEGDDARRIFWPMISNDGHSLVLVALMEGMPERSVLAVYHENDYASPKPVRIFQITDLWTPNEMDPEGKGIVIFSDGSPKWFAGGTFAFTPDDTHLLYRTQWNDYLRIDLTDGTLWREPR